MPMNGKYKSLNNDHTMQTSLIFCEVVQKTVSNGMGVLACLHAMKVANWHLYKLQSWQERKD